MFKLFRSKDLPPFIPRKTLRHIDYVNKRIRDEVNASLEFRDTGYGVHYISIFVHSDLGELEVYAQGIPPHHDKVENIEGPWTPDVMKAISMLSSLIADAEQHEKRREEQELNAHKESYKNDK